MSRMRRWSPWIAIGVIFSFALLMQAGGEHALIGKPAPSIVAELVAGPGSAEGDRISLEAEAGRVVVLDFWASWCPPCRASIPTLNRVREHFAEAPVAFYGINVEPELGIARIRDAHRSFGAVFPSIVDTTRGLQAVYRVQSLPTLFIVDSSGVVRHAHVGVPDQDWLTQAIRDLVHGI
ncbi:MAG: TlpA family protein disulfide reductase [Myxococcales bacterium]|nr:TlpA family protein disulfide reductase [Myxococcales bacterium]